MPRLPSVTVLSALALAITAPVARPCQAQRSPVESEASGLWGGIALGLTQRAILAQFDLAHLRGQRLLHARLAVHGDAGAGSGQREDLSEFAVLGGRGGRCCGQNWGAWALGAGLVEGDANAAGEGGFTTVGLAAEAFVISARAPHLVVSLFGNANSQRSFIGATLGLALGRMSFLPPQAPRRFP